MGIRVIMRIDTKLRVHNDSEETRYQAEFEKYIKSPNCSNLLPIVSGK
jgi:hypothetical protein